MSDSDKFAADFDVATTRARLEAAARAIKFHLPDGVLFALLCFDGDATGQYVSNADRADIVKALRGFATALEQHEDSPR